MEIKFCIFVLALLACSQSDTCNNLGTFITKAEQTVGNDLTSNAVEMHPKESRGDDELVNCNKEDTSCTSASEVVLRKAAVDLFDVITFKMMLSQVEDEIRTLREEVANDIFKVTNIADGEFAAGASKQYVLYGDVDVDRIARHRLVNFVKRIYGRVYDTSCFDVFTKTRYLVTNRIQALLSQYSIVVSGLLEGINLVPAIKVVASTSLSDSCKVALNRAGMFENIGCKMCSDKTSQAKTCYTLCTNVARGCMRPLLCYVDTWDEWITNQDKMTLDLIALTELRSAHVEELKNTYETEYAMLKEKNWLDEISCKPSGVDANPAAMKTLKEHDLHLPSLMIEMHEKLFKSTIRSLPTAFCTLSSSVSDNHAADDSSCWNGTDVNAYIHPTTTFDMEDQKCNPEVAVEELPCEDSTRDMSCGYGFVTEQPPVTSNKRPPAPVTEKVKGAAVRSAMSGLLTLLTAILLVVV